MVRRYRPGHWLCLLLTCPLLVLAAETEEAVGPVPLHPLLEDSFRISVGVLDAKTSSIARLDRGGGLGLDLDFEDTLGMDDKKLVGEAAILWRFGRRWRADLEYVTISRDATRTLSRDIDWGGQTFPVGSTVESSFRISDVRASLGYSFFRRPDKELGIGLGLHAAGFKASINASGIGGDEADVTAPLPVVNLYGVFALTPTWAMSTRVDWLSLAYGDYAGDIRRFALDFVYQPFRHVGFGFGYHGTLVDLEYDKTDWRGRAKVTFQGPAAYVSVSF